ncbi:subtilase family protein [Artemisia annua]|uniref:Subtilase family protein n=1 Tax=Artemisia annua TaxID=35608 RepID=A0A2U1QCX8_ARTAN|nr:subtilase family protein [Artemisia annua]
MKATFSGNNLANGAELTIDVYVLPAVTSDDAVQILKYISSTRTKTTYTFLQRLPGSMNPQKTKVKFVFCLQGYRTRVGKGMKATFSGNNLANGAELTIDVYVLPAVTSDDAPDIADAAPGLNTLAANSTQGIITNKD